MSPQNNKIQTTRFMSKGDTKQNWSENNPILLTREVGYELDTNSYKIGDGVTPWNELPYATIGIKDNDKIILQSNQVYLSNNKKLLTKDDLPTGGDTAGGVGQATADGGEIFNTYDGSNIAYAYAHAEGFKSIALSEYSHVEGNNTRAGHKGYKIREILPEHTKSFFIIVNDKDLPENERAINAYSIGDLINFNGASHHPEQLKIDRLDYYSVDEPYTVIHVNIIPESFLTSGNFIMEAPDNEYENWINVANKNVGEDIPLFYASHAEGEGTVALGRSSHAEGRQTKVISGHGHAEGKQTTAGYAAHAEGTKTYAIGDSSHAEGTNSKVYGANSHAEGIGNTIISKASHAEGANNTVSGEYSHAEGYSNDAFGFASHAEGQDAHAIGLQSHAEGYNTTSENTASHAEGSSTIASGLASHAEGSGTFAYGNYSHAEGQGCHADGDYSHVEGENTGAGYAAHAEGSDTHATGDYSHAEGQGSKATVPQAHAEGSDTTASGIASHAEGSDTTASNSHAHAEGYGSGADGDSSHAEGIYTIAKGDYSHSEGSNTTASGIASHAEGYMTTALSQGSNAKGIKTIAGCKGYRYSSVEINDNGYSTITLTRSHDGSEYWNNESTCNYLPGDVISIIADGKYYNCATIVAIDNNKIHLDKNLDEEYAGKPDYSYDSGFDGNIVFVLSKPNIGYVDLGIAATSEGGSVKDTEITAALGPFSHVEGRNNQAIGHYSHAEGRNNKASNVCAHVEGQNNKAIGELSHAEGAYTEAIGNKSHAEGNSTVASGATSHAEGNDTEASGTGSHAEGWLTIASGEYSHSEGLQTTASGDYSHVQGKYNIVDEENKYAHIVGNGKKNGNKITLSNAYTLDWDGNAWFAGDVVVNDKSFNEMNIQLQDFIENGEASFTEINNTKADKKDTYTKTEVDDKIASVEGADFETKLREYTVTWDKVTSGSFDYGLPLDFGCVENIMDDKADVTKIYSLPEFEQYQFIFPTEYNTETRFKELNTLSFTFGDEVYQNDYMSGISFDSGETPTAVDYTDSGILNWVGTDCAMDSYVNDEGITVPISKFQPSANTHYDIVFYFNGNQFIGLVNGYVPTTQLPTEQIEGNVVS